MRVQCYGCVVTYLIGMPPSPPLDKVPSMVTVGNEELARASEELSSFQSFMSPRPTATPTTAASTPATSTTKRGSNNEDKEAENQDRAKWHRGQGKGAQQRPKGRTENKQDQNKSWWDKDSRGYSKSNDELKSVVKALGRLVLRQEDSLAVMHLDCQFVIFMRNKSQAAGTMPDWSVTSQLLTVGSHWKDRKEREPQSLTQPLRTVLFSAWLTGIKHRVAELQSNPTMQEQAAQMHSGKRRVPLPPMGSGDLEACQGAATAAADDRGNTGDRPAAPAHHSPQHHWTVPPAATADAGHDKRCDSINLRNPEQNPGVTSSLPAGWPFDSQRSNTFSSLHPSTEQARPISLGHRGGQDAPRNLRPDKQRVLQLSLANPQDYSYANATLLAILWLSSCAQDGFSICHVGLYKFLQWLSTQQKPQPIWDNLAWQTLTKAWLRPLRSHDVAAFLAFTQRLIFQGTAGQWESRNPPLSISTPSHAGRAMRTCVADSAARCTALSPQHVAVPSGCLARANSGVWSEFLIALRGLASF